VSASPLSSSGFASIAHVNFEFGTTGGRVRGLVFDDADFDGFRDAGEAGLGGVTVFDDANGNDTFDSGEASGVSIADGSYEIVVAGNGVVDVRAQAQYGRFRTSPDPAPLLLSGGNTIAGVDFALGAGTRFDGFPSAAQQIPVNGSTARGTGNVVLNAAGDGVVISLAYAGLTSNVTFVRVQGPAPRGATGPTIFDLPTTGTTSGSFVTVLLAVTPAQASDVADGLWYFNIGSTLFPAGEIRGQIDNALFVDGFE